MIRNATFALLLLALLVNSAAARTSDSDEIRPGIGKKGAPARPPHLAISTDFESRIKVEQPYVHTKERVPNWRQRLLVEERGTFVPLLGGSFKYNVPAEADLSQYVKLSIETVPGPRGKPTNALLMKTRTFHPDGKRKLGGFTRNALLLFPPKQMKEIYTVYFMKFQPDLEKIMPEGKHAWRQVMEWKESGPSGYRYRWNLNIQRNPKRASHLFWRLRAQEGTQKEDKIAWEDVRTDVPVAAGKWQLLEVYWKQSSTRDGRLWVAINGKTLFDHRGPNRTSKELRKYNPWNPLKLYTGEEEIKRGEVYQWIDEFQIHTNVRR